MVLRRALEILQEDGLGELIRQADGKYRPSLFQPRFSTEMTLKRPSVLVGHIKYNFLWSINQLIHEYAYPMDAGIDVMAKDWDNLILLDACRPDMFEAANSLEGESSVAWSKAGQSYAFMKRNFEGKKLHDTVYVCANSHFAKFPDEIFHDVIHVWEHGWDEKSGTIRPETVTAAAKDAFQQYPEKRIIVHYMQPHTPFLHQMAEDVLADTEHEHFRHKDGYSLLGAIKHGLIDIDDEILLEMYIENTELALSEVVTLLEDLEGKTVISADHGELVGEQVGPIPLKFYGHGPLFYEELREVPWFLVDGQSLRTTTSEPPVEKSVYDEQKAQDQLEALGYL